MPRIRGGGFPGHKGLAFPLGGGGGVDWEDKAYHRSNTDTVAERANTYLNITGSGWLIALHSAAAVHNAFAVQIDGGSIMHFGWSGATTIPTIDRLLFWRFNTSVKVTADNAASANQDAFVLLD